MERRRFMTGAGAAGLAAGALAASNFPKPAIAQGLKELRMVTAWPKRFPGLGTAAERFAKRVEDGSEGRIKIKVFSAGELVPAFEAFDAVSGGSADLYHGAEYYWQGKTPIFNFFSNVPFGLMPHEVNAWLYFGGGQELWDEVSAGFNIKPFAAGNTGHQMAGWFRKEINSLDDLKGLKFRIPGLGGEVMRRLGVSAVSLPGGEIYAALQSGAIDGTEWVGPWNDLAFGFYKVAKYYYWPGFHEPGAIVSVGINRQLWESFDKGTQSLLTSTLAAENATVPSEFNAFNMTALDALINEHDVQLRRFPDEVLTAFKKTAQEVVAEIGNGSDAAKKVYSSYSDFLRKANEWSRISEHPYMAARLRD